MSHDADFITVEATWQVPFTHDIGPTLSRFLIEIRDNARLMATADPATGNIYLPPRSMSPTTLEPIADHWVEIEPEGVLESFTVVTTVAAAGGTPDPPYVLGLARLGRATTAIPQIIRGLDLSDPRGLARRLVPGTRVRAVFHERREGKITDFHLELSEGP
jgi:uncharacterized OB-fold protein